MLINLSNHPSSKWSDLQIKTAMDLYGPIKDMEFPHIDPNWSIEEVKALALNYFHQINEENPSAVHIMGELSFCFTLVTLLKGSGMHCIASTTERIVNQNGDQKISNFQFVRFRTYY